MADAESCACWKIRGGGVTLSHTRSCSPTHFRDGNDVLRSYPPVRSAYCSAFCTCFTLSAMPQDFVHLPREHIRARQGRSAGIECGHVCVARERTTERTVLHRLSPGSRHRAATDQEGARAVHTAHASSAVCCSGIHTAALAGETIKKKIFLYNSGIISIQNTQFPNGFSNHMDIARVILVVFVPAVLHLFDRRLRESRETRLL